MRRHYSSKIRHYPEFMKRSSHVRVLDRLLQQAPEGSIIVEFGAGHSSTPLLKKTCEERNLTGFCYEGDSSWLKEVKTTYGSDRLTFELLTVKNLTEVLSKMQALRPFLVFVDTGYLEKKNTYRNEVLQSFVNHAKYIVCHDTEPEHNKVYRYDFRGMIVNHDWLYGIRTSVVSMRGWSQN